MKAWEVLAITRNGEFVCWDCMTLEEKEVANDETEIDDVGVLFASDVNGPESCGRCLNIIDGTE